MFIQQPFRIQAEPIMEQDIPPLLDKALLMHYNTKAQQYSEPVVTIHRIEILNPVIVETSTQADMLLSVEADTVELYNLFIQSFIREEETGLMHIRPLTSL